ncbi:hypothetical protein O3P69_019068 [Scylla paramamosain]|uniref:Uncharacterized protein n=1 Tax=Scylla paramamosain TaxID=85552 RepID=A0AAW0T9B5_SCYPA
MADTLDVKIIPEFDGISHPVAEWFEKAELVCRLSNVKDLTTVVPLRLTGSEKKGIEKVKGALYSAFTAYELFMARRLKSDEVVDVYLADLRRLSSPFWGRERHRPLVCIRCWSTRHRPPAASGGNTP